MTVRRAPTGRQPLARFGRSLKDFLTSEVRWQAYLLIAFLFVFMVAVNGLNVVNSYVGRDFMTAVSARDAGGFVRFAWLYLGVFALSTAVAVSQRFTEERLGLLWRVWLTRHLVERYLSDRTYFRLKAAATVDNPDQRIADDVKTFTTTTLSFIILFLNGTVTAIAFSGVLWAISPMLFGVAVLYAGVGTLAAIFLGKPLVGLNYRQLDREADFRASLLHIGENAESIALLRREGRLTARILRRLDRLATNFRRVIAVNRNLGFFTTGYNYLIQLIPVVIVAPMYIRGQIEFGVVTQSAMAFSTLLGAFSLIVTQFQSITSFAAVVARLGALAGAMDDPPPEEQAFTVREDRDRVAWQGVTLRTADDRVLVDRLTAAVEHGTRLLVAGPADEARVALFRATAGVWPSGDGTVARPSLDEVLFLTQRPYLPPGTLRDLLVRTGRDREVTDDRVRDALVAVGLKGLLAQVGSLDEERDWAGTLSLGDQQLLAFARLLLAKPRFALLDRVTTALPAERVAEMLQLFRAAGVSYLTFMEGRELERYHDHVLELGGHGHWSLGPAAGGEQSGK